MLLSYDKNLCTKAMLHDIPTIGRDDPWEKMFWLKAAETRDFLSNSLHAHIEEKAEDVTLLQKEMLEAEDVMEEAKAILKLVLSEVNFCLFLFLVKMSNNNKTHSILRL